jgi:hypothetical protein
MVRPRSWPVRLSYLGNLEARGGHALERRGDEPLNPAEQA